MKANSNVSKAIALLIANAAACLSASAISPVWGGDMTPFVTSSDQHKCKTEIITDDSGHYYGFTDALNKFVRVVVNSQDQMAGVILNPLPTSDDGKCYPKWEDQIVFGVRNVKHPEDVMFRFCLKPDGWANTVTVDKKMTEMTRRQEAYCVDVMDLFKSRYQLTRISILVKPNHKITDDDPATADIGISYLYLKYNVFGAYFQMPLNCKTQVTDALKCDCEK